MPSIWTDNPGSFLGHTVRITGEIVCRQDLYIEGELEGKIDVPNHKLTIGPSGQVKADIHARNVVVVGAAEAHIVAGRVELCSQSRLVGDIQTPRIVIKDGAHFQGSIEVIREVTPPADPVIGEVA